MNKVGINAIAIDIPKIYLPIATLAEARNIEAEKLTKGLGLQKMTLPDVHQDVITLAANAVIKLVNQNNITLSKVSRLYVGTECGVDSSKPIASYLVSILENKYGEGVLKNCDVVDLVFACIGGIDAMENCIDYIRHNPDEKAIVVTTDIAKYDLESTGEYTQGAGAIAMEISANPHLLSFDKKSGVSTEGVFDFFKPRRSVQKSALGIVVNENWHGVLEEEISIYKEQPVFDGQYSNTCYINRIKDAYLNFKEKNKITNKPYENWAFICMHLPYCYQGRRTFIDIFAIENPKLLDEQQGETSKDKMKSLAKSKDYSDLVESKIYPTEIASAEVGNIYTGSIFLGLVSALDYSKDKAKIGSKIGLIAYGSGSKSKVIEATIEAGFQTIMEEINLLQMLSDMTPIDIDTYHKLHKKELKKSIRQPMQEVVLEKIESENPVLIGARYYKYVAD